MANPAFIRHSPEREAEIQRRLLDVAEGRFRRKIAKVIREESEQLIAKYRELGYVPAPTDDDFRAFKDVYLDIGKVTARAFGSRIVAQGKAAGLILETKVSFTDLFLSLATQWVNLEAIRRRITQVTETTRERIVRQVAAGQDEGLGVEAIAKQINQAVPKISRTRGALIARTETHGAANYAMHETAKTTGLELVKEWVAVEDARTRRFAQKNPAEYDHVSMNGQQREMDEPFQMPWIGGEPIAIMYPGQAGLPGAATINCRCAVVHRVKGVDDDPQASPAAIAAGTSQPVDGFAYQNFVAPKSVAEMQNFITKNNIADAADFKGLKVAGLSNKLVHFQEVTERFDLDPLIGVGPATRFGMRKIKDANAAIFRAVNKSTGREGIFHLPAKFTDDANYNSQREIALRSRERFNAPRKERLERDINLSPEVRTIAQQMDSRGDIYSWTFSVEMTPEEARRFVIYHEYGHVLHLTNTRNRKMSQKINEFLASQKPRQNGWDLLISKYGGTNDNEYVAEAFSIYMAGPDQHYRIHPKLFAIFKEFDRAA